MNRGRGESSKLQISNFKQWAIGIWSLMFLWSLDLGVWNFSSTYRLLADQRKAIQKNSIYATS
jgi:hypothetical protein